MTNLGLFRLTDLCHLGAPDLFLSPWEGLSLLWVALLVNSRRQGWWQLPEERIQQPITASYRSSSHLRLCEEREGTLVSPSAISPISSLPIKGTHTPPTELCNLQCPYNTTLLQCSKAYCIFVHIRLEALKNKVAQGNKKFVVQKRCSEEKKNLFFFFLKQRLLLQTPQIIFSSKKVDWSTKPPSCTLPCVFILKYLQSQAEESLSHLVINQTGSRARLYYWASYTKTPGKNSFRFLHSDKVSVCKAFSGDSNLWTHQYLILKWGRQKMEMSFLQIKPYLKKRHSHQRFNRVFRHDLQHLRADMTLFWCDCAVKDGFKWSILAST